STFILLPTKIINIKVYLRMPSQRIVPWFILRHNTFVRCTYKPSPTEISSHMPPVEILLGELMPLISFNKICTSIITFKLSERRTRQPQVHRQVRFNKIEVLFVVRPRDIVVVPVRDTRPLSRHKHVDFYIPDKIIYLLRECVKDHFC